MADPLLERLRGDVNTSAEEDTVLQACLAEARALVDAYITDNVDEDGVTDGDPIPDAIPDAILDRAYLEVGADLFNRRQAPNGVMNQQYDAGMGDVTAPIRINRDPLTPAYSLLAPWVLPVSIG